jgi:hypothetical protein
MNHGKIMMLVLAVSLGGCNGSAPTSDRASQSAGAIAPVAVPIEQSKASQGKSDMSSLESVLTVFSSKDGMRWDSYDSVSGVQWRDPAPVENPDATESRESRYRSGNILLTGFGMVDVPDGKVGADAGVKQDNEGNSGITLNGDVNSVRSVAIMKFYPSENYQDILQQQLGGAGAMKLIADQCALDYGTTAENTKKNMFYQISLPAGGLLYAEAYVDEEGGKNTPGSTTFEFTTEKPTQRIASMRCRES